MHPQPDILQLASRQGGVIRRDQAIDAGFTGHQVDRRVAKGEWQLVAKGAYRLIDLPGNANLLRSAAAVLPNATVSHYSAAAFHGLSGVSRDTVSVTVRSKTTHDFPGVRVFRTDDLKSEHLSIIRGLRTTSLDRTVIDLAAALSPRHLEYILDDLLAEGRCSLSDLRVVLESVARRGKPGVSAICSLLDDRSPADENRSRLERAVNALLMDRGITDFVREFPIPWTPHRRFDVAFPTERVAIEWDSIRWHTQKQRFQSDRERDRLAIENEWRVFRFTWRDVHVDPNGVIDSIRVVLAATQPAHNT